MNTILKRVISMVLCFVLVAGYLPVGTFATEAVETVPAETTAVTEETIQVLSEDAEEPSESTETTEDESEITEPSTEAAVPETTEETVPETTEETVPETTEETVPETTEETVPETTEETVPETTEAVILEEEVTEEVTSEAMLANVEDAVDAAIFFSDLHTSKNDYKESTVNGIMTTMKNTGLLFSSVTSCGDAFSVNADNDWSNGKYTGKTSTITGYIQGVLGNIPVHYVWSDHDRYAVEADNTTLLNKTSRLVYGAGNDGVYGTDDDGNYYVYSLSMGDLCSYDRYSAGFNYTTASNSRASKGFTATVPEAIAKFEADVANLKKDRPLFIASHQPLFDNRDDNAWAEDWFDAINEVAEDMDVAYFYGHNHKYDSGSDYYYAKGKQMPVATDGDWNFNYEVGVGYKPSVKLSSVSKTLNFTHMCAGYLAPSSTGSTSSTTREGTAVAVTILEDSISYVTYDKNGVYTGSYALNETVTREHAGTQTETPDPSEPTVPSAPESTEVTVGDVTATISGATITASGAVSDADKALLEAKGYAGFVAMDVTATVDGESATVTFPIPEGWDPARVVGISVKDGAVEEIHGTAADGKFTFSVTHFSTTGIALTAESSELNWVHISTSSGEAYYELAKSVESGATYLIASGASNSVRLLKKDGTRSGNVPVSNSQITSGAGDDYEWTFATSGNGYTIKDSDNEYLYPDATRYSSYGSWYYSLVSDGSSETAVNVSMNGTSGATTISREVTSGTRKTTSYVYYNSSSYSGGFTADDSTYDLYLFKKVSQPAGSVYAAMEGTTELTFALGSMEDEDILNAVKSAIKVYTATDANGTGKTLTNDYQLVGSVDGNTANTYTLSVQYGGKELGQVKVTVAAKTIKTISVAPNPMTVFVGTNLSKKAADITVTYDDDTTLTVPLTLDMLTGNFSTDAVATYENLTVTYGGKTATVTLNVIEKIVNNYPEYPDEGAVKVSKTGTGIDFQSSGIAQVEVSASGVPMKRGADVIVMLDTSSSMTKNNVTGTNKTRAAVLEESLANLIAYFKTPGADGEPMDLRVAIADFNGYYGDNSKGTSGTPYDRTSGDYVKNGNSNGTGYQQPSEAQVYTGSKALDKDAFIDAADLANTYTLNYTSGTNYDYAFDAIYQLGTAIKTEDRDLFVIFMSDGASLQWNYFGTENGYTKWNNWLAGTWDADDLTTTNLNSTKHSYFYDLKDHDGDGHINEHRMANAIKGDPDLDYEIIRKSTAGLPTGTLTPVEGKEYLYTVPGLGATMFTINFDAKQDGQITVDNIDKALASTASNQTGTTKYYYKVTTAAELAHAFDAIGSEIAYAAYNARFVDQMGANYNLQMETDTYRLSDGTSKTLAPKIEILSYSIYTRQDFLNGDITEDKIGDRKLDSNGNPISTVLETVTFKADGTEAYSDKKSGNILNSGIINAQSFWYNTNATPVTIEGVSIPTGTNANGTTFGSTNQLPAETFYWKMGTVQTAELAMRYYVYLDGSMEGTREGGSYPTNEFATLYYDNYVQKHCYKDTVSPVLAWKEANVSYAFYLVNANGEIIVNQNSGQTGSFANKIAITNPVVYKTILLNSGTDVEARILADDDDVLPQYYTLYDEDAAYQINISSNGEGSWAITKGNGMNASTYVTQYDPSNAAAYSKELTNNATGNDYTHTVVWFAVVWNVGAYPDSVVIDYGLPVEISVLTNDMFGDYGRLAGVGDYDTVSQYENGHTKDNVLNSMSYPGTFGTATADAATGKVRYELSKSNGMQMNTYEKFGYAVNYIGSNPGYYYSSVTVIPATTIYYEDNFLTYGSYTWNNGWVPVVEKTDPNWTWKTEPQTPAGTQGEDRPGKYALQDANNIYGYDGANLNMSTHSLNSAMMATVDYNNYAEASFTFYGTGFDVISMTNNTTGTIFVDVQKRNGENWTDHDNFAVDTYYGYKQDAEGKWVVDPNAAGSMYQVPVIKMADQNYGQYKVTIKATYDPGFDHVAPSYDNGSYDFYLDAIRIYDPANDGASDGPDDTTIEDAYVADGEGWPSYFELRNKLITTKTLGNAESTTKIIGEVFIDGDAKVGDAQLQDYKSYGPNNEVYLDEGQSIAFKLNDVMDANNKSIVAQIHLGIKSANGEPVTYVIKNVAKQDIGTHKAGTDYNEKTAVVGTTTDMYYDITGYKNDIIVITNTSGGILSLTNIKATYTTNPNGAALHGVNDGNLEGTGGDDTETPASNEVYAYMTPNAAMLTLRALNASAGEENPEPSVPESSEPEESEPEEIKPVKPGKTDLKKAVDAAKKLKEKDYTKDSFQAVKSALKVAEKVLKNKKASQTQIEAAFEALESAVKALEAKPDNTALKKAVDKAKKLKEKNYTKDSFKNFKNALKAAEKVLKNKNANQAEIHEALAELNEAMSSLAKKSSDKKPGKKK